MMKRILVPLLALLCMPIFVYSQSVTIDLSAKRQLIKGFGGMNHPVWAGDLTATQRNTAFGNGEGQLGMTICRIYVHEDRNQWNREVATAKAAQATGALLLASPWNPPTSMTELFTKSGDEDAKRLKYDSYGAYAQHLIDFVTYMKSQGVNLYSISIQNEPDWGFDWTWWTSAEMFNFVKNNAKVIRTAHPDVKVMAAESFGYSKGMTDPILNDSTALSHIDIFGVHTYGVSSPSAYPLLKSKANKEFWMTEVYHPNSDEASADRWPEALEVGLHMHKCLVDAEMQAYIWWYIRRQYSPMKEDGTMSKRGACFSQFSKYVRPGAYRLSVSSNPITDVYLSAFQSGDEVSIVLINKATTAKTLTINIPDANVPRWEQYVTSATKNVVKSGEYSTKTSIQVTLEAQSMSTIVGKKEFGTPEFVSANPENGSFNLPLTTNTFKFKYNNKVDCSKATAKLVKVGQTDTTTLLIQETGFSDTLTFVLPQSVQLLQGEYQITVSDLISDYGLQAWKNDVIKFYVATTGGNNTIQTVFEDGLDGGGIIPAGWILTWNGNTRVQNTSGLTSGPRLIDFPNGGDYNAGFYLRDEGTTSSLNYGTYDGSRLYLQKGNYAVSFYYSIWTGTNLTLDFAVSNQSGSTIFEQKGITTTHTLNNSAANIPTGSKLCTYEFEVPSDGNYILNWGTAGTGWNGVIVGNVKVTTTIDPAIRYLAMFNEALAEANVVKTLANSSIYNGTIKTNLLNTIDTYTNAVLTSPSSILEAVDLLTNAATATRSYITNIDLYEASIQAANNQLARYASTKYSNSAPYKKLVSFMSVYGSVDRNSASIVKTATDSLNHYASLVPNWINNAVPALTYRIQKGYELGFALSLDSTKLAPALNAITDDETIITFLKRNLPTAYTEALTNGTLKLKANSSDPDALDSLDMSFYIKNPNFYTLQQTSGLFTTTFPGWTTSNNLTGLNAGPNSLAVNLNPVSDTHVKLNNMSVVSFEQRVSSLPSGTYSIYLKTRSTSNLSNPSSATFYVINGIDTIFTDFAKGGLELTQVGFKNVSLKGSITLGVRTKSETGASPVFEFGDASIFMTSTQTTALNQPENDGNTKEIQYFNVMGQRIQKPSKGIYIEKIIKKTGETLVRKVEIAK